MQAKRCLLRKKREDKMKAPADCRIPEGYHDKLVPTDIMILLNLVFDASHSDVAANLRTIAVCGLVPFTRVLLEHPEVVAGSTARVEGRKAATDAAAAAAGDVNLGALNLEGLRRLSMDAFAGRDRASTHAASIEIIP